MRDETLLAPNSYHLETQLANGTTMSITGGGAYFWPFNLSKSGYGLLGVYIGIKSTQARTNMPVCRFVITLPNGSQRIIMPYMPYVIEATPNITGGARYWCGFRTEDGFIMYSPSFAANSTVTFTMFAIGYHK